MAYSDDDKQQHNAHPQMHQTNGSTIQPSASEENLSLRSLSDDDDGAVARPIRPAPSPLFTSQDRALSSNSNDYSSTQDNEARPTRPVAPRRQSSFAKPHTRAPGMPRTPNRVRFDLEATDIVSPATQNGTPRGSQMQWLQEEDPLEDDDRLLQTGRDGQSLPLLTGIEAPSVTVASDGDEVNPEDLLESARPKSGMKSAFMNMANSIIGAGIIGQPYALRQAGLLTGVALLVVLTVLVDWTIRLIVINSKMSGTDSFQATCQHCFGRPGLIAISLAQWAFAFGGMVAFCIIVGDTIPHVIASMFPSFADQAFLWLLTDRRAVIIILILGVSYPLSLYRDISKLAKASTLALISMIVIIIAVITQGARIEPSLRGTLDGHLWINSGVFQAIGVISFAFVCHHNSLLIYGSLRKPTIDRFTTVTHYSTFVSMIACMSMALAGFLTFGDLTDGNVLNNFPRANLVVNIARLCFGLNMLTTFPLETFVAREVMTLFYFPGEAFNPTRHLMFTTALVIAAMSLSLFTCDLGAVFELIGATSACAMAYILPPLCFIRLSKRRDWRIWAATGVVIFGSGVFVISLFLAIVKIVRNQGDPRVCT